LAHSNNFVGENIQAEDDDSDDNQHVISSVGYKRGGTAATTNKQTNLNRGRNKKSSKENRRSGSYGSP